MGLLYIALTGVLATTVMLAVMSFIHYMKWANADMVRAVGTLYARSDDWAQVIGFLVSFSFGIAFAFLYAILIGVSPVWDPSSAVVICTFAGFVHGLVVGLMLMVLVGEHHPVARFRKVSLGVAVAHVIGHIFYGFTVGLSFALGWKHIHSTLENFATGRVIGDLLGFAFIWFPLFGIPLIFFGYMIYSFSTSEKNREGIRLPKKKRI